MTVTPKPDATRFISEEAFAEWCDHPCTKFVAASHAAMVRAQKAAWDQSSWDGGTADPLWLLELRTRADCYQGFLDAGWRQHAANLTEQPVWWKYFQDQARTEGEKRKAK